MSDFLLQIPNTTKDFNCEDISSVEWAYKHKTVLVSIVDEGIFIFTYDTGDSADSYCITVIKDNDDYIFEGIGSENKDNRDEILRGIYWVNKAMADEKYQPLIIATNV